MPPTTGACSGADLSAEVPAAYSAPSPVPLPLCSEIGGAAEPASVDVPFVTAPAAKPTPPTIDERRGDRGDRDPAGPAPCALRPKVGDRAPSAATAMAAGDGRGQHLGRVAGEHLATTPSANPSRGSTSAAGSAACSRATGSSSESCGFSHRSASVVGSLRLCPARPGPCMRGSDLASERQPLAPRLTKALASTRECGVRTRSRDAEYLGELFAVESLPRVQQQDRDDRAHPRSRGRPGARHRRAR